MSPGSFAFELLEYNEIKISNSAKNLQFHLVLPKMYALFVSYVIEQMVRYVDSKGVSHMHTFRFPHITMFGETHPLHPL